MIPLSNQCRELARYSVVFYLLIFSGNVAYSQTDWQELKGTNFIIYYSADHKTFAHQVLKHAQKYYRHISKDLGYQRYDNFWQWDNRVKIYLYATLEAYRAEEGVQGWSHGVASYDDMTIRTYVNQESFMESLLPHEITHLMFRDYVGFEGNIPQWLDEGVAQWEEPEKRRLVRPYMYYLYEQGKAMPVRTLTSIDIRVEQDEEAVMAYYVQAMSLVDFLIHEYGTNDFITFCRQLRDGKSFEGALRFTYPTQIRSIEQLEEQWRDYVLAAKND